MSFIINLYFHNQNIIISSESCFFFHVILYYVCAHLFCLIIYLVTCCKPKKIKSMLLILIDSCTVSVFPSHSPVSFFFTFFCIFVKVMQKSYFTLLWLKPKIKIIATFSDYKFVNLVERKWLIKKVARKKLFYIQQQKKVIDANG